MRVVHLMVYEFAASFVPLENDASTRGACVQRLAVPSAVVGPDPPTSLAGVRTPRRVSHFDAAIGKRLVFLTNNFALPAPTIA